MLIGQDNEGVDSVRFLIPSAAIDPERRQKPVRNPALRRSPPMVVTLRPGVVMDAPTESRHQRETNIRVDAAELSRRGWAMPYLPGRLTPMWRRLHQQLLAEPGSGRKSRESGRT